MHLDPEMFTFQIQLFFWTVGGEKGNPNLYFINGLYGWFSKERLVEA